MAKLFAGGFFTILVAGAHLGGWIDVISAIKGIFDYLMVVGQF